MRKAILIAAALISVLSTTGLAQDLLQQGRDYQAKGDLSQARRCYQQCLQQRELEHGPQSQAVQAVLISLAELCRSQNQFRQALEYLHRATQIGEVLGQNDDTQLLRRLEVCDLYFQTLEYESARRAIDDVIDLARERWGDGDARTQRAVALQDQVYRRLRLTPPTPSEGSAVATAAGPRSADEGGDTPAGTVAGPVPGQLGIYRVQWSSRLEAGRAVRVVRDGRQVGRGVINGSGDLNLIGTQSLVAGDQLLAQPVAQPASQAPKISHAYRMAEETWNRMLATGKVKLSHNDSYAARVTSVGQKVAAASNRKVPWNFFVVDNKSPNASCLGEGFVFVTTGLLQLHLTDDELAGVLAHEIAHGTEQHLLHDDLDRQLAARALRELEEARALYQRYVREYEREASSGSSASIAEASFESKLATVRRRISEAERKVNYLKGRDKFETEFNHEQEIEADTVGIRYAVTAGYSAEGLAQALTKLDQYGVDTFGVGYSSAGKTHPSTRRRLEVLQKVLSSWRSR